MAADEEEEASGPSRRAALSRRRTFRFAIRHLSSNHKDDGRSKIWPRHSLRRPRFPIRQKHFHYPVTFTGNIRCFCATTSHDLVVLTFDLLTLRVCRVQCFSCLTHITIFIILRLSVTELRVLIIWSYFRYLKQSSRMRRVTWPLTGGKK